MDFWNVVENNNLLDLKKIINQLNIDRNIINGFGYSPIMTSLSKSNLEMGKVLIENNFNVNLQDQKGQTALHYAAFYGYTEIAEILLKKNAFVDIEDNYGNEPLWIAVFHDKGFGRRLEIIKLLKSYGADANHKNKVGKTPLDFATATNNSNVISILKN